MNKVVVNTIIFGLGAAIGGFTGYKIAQNKLEKDFAEQLNTARNHYKSKYEAKLNEGLKAAGIDILEKGEEKTVEEPKEEFRTAKIPNVEDDYTRIVQKEDYSRYSKEEKVDDKIITNGPKQVSENEYDDALGIERYELTYFKEDEVVMDSKENVWNDGRERIGYSNIDDVIRNEEDEIFVINEDYGEGYHVTVEEGSYNGYMAGFEE